MTESEWLVSDDPQAMLTVVYHDARPEIPRRPSDRKLRLFACACSRRFEKPIGTWVQEWEDDTAWPKEIVHINLSNCALSWTEDPDNRVEVSNLLRDIVNPFRPVTLPKGPAEFCRRCQGDGWVPTPDGLYASRAICKACDGKGTLNLFARCPWRTPVVLSITEQAYDERPGRKCEECRGKGSVRKAEIYASRFDREECGSCHGTGHIEDGSLDPVTLSVLADALEDAGCDNQAILDHFKGEVCPYCKDASFATNDLGTPFLTGDQGPIRRRVMESCACKGTRRLSPGPHVRGCWALDLLLGKE